VDRGSWIVDRGSWIVEDSTIRKLLPIRGVARRVPWKCLSPK
jgi:hypothetical protein